MLRCSVAGDLHHGAAGRPDVYRLVATYQVSFGLIGYGSKLGTPKLWMVNTKLDIHICGPTSVFHFDQKPIDVSDISCSLYRVAWDQLCSAQIDSATSRAT